MLVSFTFQLKSQVQPKINSKLYAKNLALANEAFDSEDYLNAIKLYEKVLYIDPNHEISNLNSAISRIKLNQPTDSCIPHLAKLKTSATPEVQFYFGKIYYMTSNFEEAIKCYTKYKSISSKKKNNF